MLLRFFRIQPLSIKLCDNLSNSAHVNSTPHRTSVFTRLVCEASLSKLRQSGQYENFSLKRVRHEPQASAAHMPHVGLSNSSTSEIKEKNRRRGVLIRLIMFGALGRT